MMIELAQRCSRTWWRSASARPASSKSGGCSARPEPRVAQPADRGAYREVLRLPMLVENDASMAAFAVSVRRRTRVPAPAARRRRDRHRGRDRRRQPPVPRSHGFASEIGHIVEPGGPVCGCGNRGCWEQVAAGRAIGRMEPGRHGEGALLAGLAGGDPDKVTGRLVTEAALQGDERAKGSSPKPAGGSARGSRGTRERARPPDRRCRRRSDRGRGPPPGSDEGLVPGGRRGPDYRPTVPIVPAELGNDAGAVGAGSLALEELRG